MSNANEADVKEIAEIVRHALLVCVVLSVWIITAWWIDKILLGHFPLERMSLISCRFLEVFLHISTFKLTYRLLFLRADDRKFRWWV